MATPWFLMQYDDRFAGTGGMREAEPRAPHCHHRRDGRGLSGSNRAIDGSPDANPHWPGRFCLGDGPRSHSMPRQAFFCSSPPRNYRSGRCFRGGSLGVRRCASRWEHWCADKKRKKRSPLPLLILALRCCSTCVSLASTHSPKLRMWTIDSRSRSNQGQHQSQGRG